jgi:hypothetical protein
MRFDNKVHKLAVAAVDKPQYSLMMLAVFHTYAVVLWQSLSGVYYCLSVLVCHRETVGYSC